MSGRIQVIRTSLEMGERALEIPDLSLLAGGVYAICGKSQSPIVEFLYFITGLTEALRQRLRPVNQGLGARSPDLAAIIPNRTLLDGESVMEMDRTQRARQVGYIFENPEWAFLCGTVAEDFNFSFYACGLAPPLIYHLNHYGLFEVRSQPPERLSGGEQQRLSCAPIIERSPKFVVADFSSSNLDRAFHNDVLRPWIDAAAQLGSTFIVRGIPEADLPRCDGTLVVHDNAVELGAPDPGHFPSKGARRDAVARAFVPRDVDLTAAPVLVARAAQTPYGKVPITMEMRPGQIAIVTGPNGSGKTSFGRAVIGDLRIVRGYLNIAPGARPTMAFQNPEHCLFSSTVSAELREKRLLALCGLDAATWFQNPLALPRSKQKLVSIVAACQMAEELVILDEPTVGLDFEDELRLMAILDRYRHLAALLFTHDDTIIALGAKPGAEHVDIASVRQ